jgi:monofunctional glycosyltransferase
MALTPSPADVPGPGSTHATAAAAGPAPRQRRPGLRRALAWIGVGFLFALGIHGALVFRQVWRLRTHDPGTTAFMRSGLETLQQQNPGARLQHRWVPYDRISEDLKRAVIASEDQKFVSHHGFDFEAIHEAYEANARRGRIRHGGSTISQQLAKNLFLSSPRTYLRKAREVVITLMLETALSKRRILEIYLNVIEWGDGIYGADAAAQFYFGETAADLSPKEAARLAAMIPRPRFYSRNPKTPYLRERASELLDLMPEMRVP